MKRYGLRDDQFERIELLLPGRPGTVGRNSDGGNPLFVEAKDILQQLNSSALDDKTGWAKRFHDLEQEQQLLWSVAEQVDSGQCTGSCVDLYNSRVVAWQSSLESFIHDARLVAEQIRLV